MPDDTRREFELPLGFRATRRTADRGYIRDTWYDLRRRGWRYLAVAIHRYDSPETDGHSREVRLHWGRAA